MHFVSAGDRAPAKRVHADLPCRASADKPLPAIDDLVLPIGVHCLDQELCRARGRVDLLVVVGLDNFDVKAWQGGGGFLCEVPEHGDAEGIVGGVYDRRNHS